MALSAVVLPAPLGPMIPRMRPSSTRKSMLSSAMVVPNVLRRPWASITVMASVLLLFGWFGWGCRLRRAFCGPVEQFFRFEAEPLNGCGDPGPFFGEKFLAFALQQQIARTSINEKAEASPGLNEPLVRELLIAFENREWIDQIFGRDIAHRWQHITFFEHFVEYHGDDAIPKLAVNRLIVIPLTIHPVFQRVLY